MNDFLKWFFAFITAILQGFGEIFLGIGRGFKAIFDIPSFVRLFRSYSGSFGVTEWILAILAILIVAAVYVLVGFLIVLLIRKYVRFRHSIVSNEDLLEEIVGEIWDEDDVVEEPFVELEEGVLLVDADESVSDVMEQLDYEDPDGDEELVNTRMGEWAYEQFTAIPQPGDSFTYHRVSVTVIGMEHNRILKLRVTLLPEDKGGESA